MPLKTQAERVIEPFERYARQPCILDEWSVIVRTALSVYPHVFPVDVLVSPARESYGMEDAPHYASGKVEIPNLKILSSDVIQHRKAYSVLFCTGRHTSRRPR